MLLTDFATPIGVLLSFSSIWHANVLMAVVRQERSPSRVFAMIIGMIIFTANTAGAMWAIRIGMEVGK
jgi:hypothetical protein